MVHSRRSCSQAARHLLQGAHEERTSKPPSPARALRPSCRAHVAARQGNINAIDTRADVVATAGADGSVVLFDRAAGRVRAQLAAHAKRVTGAAATPHLCKGVTQLLATVASLRSADGA